MSEIPIEVAKKIADEYDQSIVTIIAWEGESSSSKSGVTHVVTYGRSAKECDHAADLGNQIKKKILKWPDDQCHAKPKRTDK
jgi:hypothetical protein